MKRVGSLGTLKRRTTSISRMWKAGDFSLRATETRGYWTTSYKCQREKRCWIGHRYTQGCQHSSPAPLGLRWVLQAKGKRQRKGNQTLRNGWRSWETVTIWWKQQLLFLFKRDQFRLVQLLSRARLFATPWTAARQASLSITSSQSLLKLTSIESVMPSNHLNLCRPLLLPPSIIPSIRLLKNPKFRAGR